MSRDGRLVGQDCSDATLQEIADLTRRYEPSITPVIKNWAVDARTLRQRLQEMLARVNS